MNQSAPPVRDLLLVGGGHAHIQVLRALGMRPIPGVRVTVITREVLSPYSGMLPGHVAGFYTRAEMHVDLVPLCRLAGARLIAGEVTGIDPGSRRVFVAGRGPVQFDWLSLNTGAVPTAPAGGVAVKPIGRFLPAWDVAKARLPAGARLIVVGAGAGGVELAFAIRAARPDLSLAILGRTWLPGFTPGVGQRLRDRALALRIDLELGIDALGFDGSTLQLEGGRSMTAAEVFWVTDVAAPVWLKDSSLATDRRGFVVVGETLQSISHPHVLAVGDVACLQNQERPKSGVYAVRAGPVLTANLRALAAEEPLQRFRPQRAFLRLIGTGDGSAVAAKWNLSFSGRSMWRWKDWIDRRFMRMFQELPVMTERQRPRLPGPLQADVPEPMRCGGCGAKLGADLLHRVLDRLPIRPRPDVLLGIGEDAAEIAASGSVLVSTDGLRAMVDDPWLFGRIVTHHNLNDLYAMGATPTGAVALATVPLMAEAMMEEELAALLGGVVDVLEAHDVPLIGGHSAEGAELFLGLTVTGKRGPVTFRKSGLEVGQRLILTKPIGTGVILAAAMRGRPVAESLATAIRSMDTSNAACVDILVEHGATGVTDVTGFGLLGHLAEMLRASGTGVDLRVDAVPCLPGARALLQQGVRSSLQDNNEQVLADFDDPGGTDVRLLCDPQTSGGLLAGIDAERADACVDALRAAGYLQTADIGEVTSGSWRLR